tara:strand:- start:198 stop:467 length:270 start_codon:yes stop_codon:yes gene_type:complete
MKKKLIYPLYAILFVFFLSIANLLVAKEIDEVYFPGTRWLETDNFIGGSKAGLEADSKEVEIQPIEFAEDISIPDLPNLLDIPLTEEDK